jgi:hypothetical protein
MSSTILQLAPSGPALEIRDTLVKAGDFLAMPAPRYRLSLDVIPVGRLTLFALLSLADLCLTWVLLRSGGGLIYESNPLANAFLMRFGWAGMILFKVADVLFVAWLALLLAIYRPEAGCRVLTVACSLVGVVVLYSGCLVARIGTCL